MSDMRWTLLRHATLREVATDGMRYRYWPSTPGSPRHFEHRRRELGAAEKRTLTALLNECLIVGEELGVATLARGLQVSDVGAARLSRWDRDYPPAATPRPEEQR